MQLEASDIFQYCSSDSSDEDCSDYSGWPSSSSQPPASSLPSHMVPLTSNDNESSTESPPPLDPPPRKRRCCEADSLIDAHQLERFVDEMQGLSSETLVSKISGLVPTIYEIKSGKVSVKVSYNDAQHCNNIFFVGVGVSQLRGFHQQCMWESQYVN